MFQVAIRPPGRTARSLASWVANTATGRPAFGDRFHTANEESALLARGFEYGTAPNALVIGWNRGHTAVTLPDGTPVSSGESGGVKIGGGGAYQRQFTHHMYLPLEVQDPNAAPAPGDDPTVINVGNTELPPPPPEPAPAPDLFGAPPVIDPVNAELPPPPPEPAPFGEPVVVNAVNTEMPPPPPEVPAPGDAPMNTAM